MKNIKTITSLLLITQTMLITAFADNSEKTLHKYVTGKLAKKYFEQTESKRPSRQCENVTVAINLDAQPIGIVDKYLAYKYGITRYQYDRQGRGPQYRDKNTAFKCTKTITNDNAEYACLITFGINNNQDLDEHAHMLNNTHIRTLLECIK